MPHRTSIARAAGAALALLAGTAAAQAPEALPEIVVTAQKVEQPLARVPASVSAVDGDLMRASAATSFADLQDYVTNATIAISVSAGQFAIRGFATQDSNAGFDPSVGTVVDGLYYGRSNFLSAFFHDIDRIEVVRGPQGTLFGRNSTAGLLNVTTRAPGQETELRAEALIEDDGDVSYRPVIGTALGERLALRLSGNYERARDGLLYNTFLDRPERNPEQDTTRLRLRWFGDDDWHADLTGLVSSQQQNFNLFRFTQLTPAMRELVQSYDPRADDDVTRLTNSANLPSLEKGRIRVITGALDLPAFPRYLHDARFSAVAGIAESVLDRRDLDADFSPVPFIRDSLREPARFRQRSLELRLAGEAPTLLGAGHGLTWIAGLYGYDAQYRTSDLFEVEDLGAAFAYLSAAQGGGAPGPGAGGSGTIGGLLGGPLGQALTLLSPATGPFIGEEQSAEVALAQRARVYALFGQLEHRFTPSWGVLAGLRVGTEQKVGDMSSQANGELVPLIADQENHQSHRERRDRDVSPRAGLTWQPAESINTYLTWSRGFKSGGFNALPLNARNLEFDPERATSVELGAKARFLAGALRVSAAAFSTDFENLQVSTFQNNSFVILNAAEARSRGFEAELDWLPPLPGAALRASVGMADARYRRYPDAPLPASQAREPALPAGCEAAPGAPGCEREVTQDLSGHPLAFAPRWTAALVPSVSLPVTAGTGAVIALDVLYRGERSLNVDDDPAKRQPATTQLNARVTFAHASRDWALTFAARNLTDELILDQAIDQPLAPGNITAVRTDRGRFYAANLTLAF